MLKHQKINCIIYTILTFTAINIAWIGIEYILYGEVQPRLVDDIISVPIMLIIYFMWKFKIEKDNLIGLL